MLGMKRIYWSRQMLELACSAVVIWLIVSAKGALMPYNAVSSAGPGFSGVSAVAADLCEMEAGFRRRCSRPAEHGDHLYPWSKGGSTSLQNVVAACAGCHRRKGARIPSPGQQERIERRRRDYVVPHGSV